MEMSSVSVKKKKEKKRFEISKENIIIQCSTLLGIRIEVLEAADADESVWEAVIYNTPVAWQS